MTRSVSAEGRCRHVEGHIHAALTSENCASPLGLCTAGTVSGGGPLDGATTFLTLSAAPSAGMPGVEAAANLSYSGDFTLKARRGTLESSDLGALDASHALFVEMYRPLSGTGIFANWTGALFSSGVLVDNGTAFDGKIHGEICSDRFDD
jgi:hypothetical protein